MSSSRLPSSSFVLVAVLLMGTGVQAQPVVEIPVFQPACRQMSIDVLNVGTAPSLRGQPALQQVKAELPRVAPDVTIAIVDAGVAVVSNVAGRLTTAVDLVVRNEVEMAKDHAKRLEEEAKRILEREKESVRVELETAKRDSEVELNAAKREAERTQDKAAFEDTKQRVKVELEDAKRDGEDRLKKAERKAKDVVESAKGAGESIKEMAKHQALERERDEHSLRGHGKAHPWAADDPRAWEGDGHGTAMASLVAAAVGEAQILPVRVIGEGCLGTALELAWGIELAAELGADVISVSISTPEYSERLAEAVAKARAAGALVIAASGNSGEVEYPAAFPSVLSVTAVDEDGWPMFPGPGAGLVDIAAPGMDVVAASPSAGVPGEDEGRGALSGTSPATALVAAAAAIVVQRTPGASVEEREALLLQAVKPMSESGPDLSAELGRGLLDFSMLPAPASEQAPSGL